MMDLNAAFLNKDLVNNFLERPLRLKRRYLDHIAMRICAERSHFMTEYFKQSDGVPIIRRRAKAFADILNNVSIVINEDELVVGSQTKYVRGCSAYPELSVDWIEKEIDALDTREVKNLYICKEDRDTLIEDVAYWKGRCIKDKGRGLAREIYGSKFEDYIAARVFYDLTGITQGRCAPDYPKVLEKGFKGIIAEAQNKLQSFRVNQKDDLCKKYFWEAVIISCQAVIDFAHRYAALARKLAEQISEERRKVELLQIAEICEWVPENPARNFREAVQSFWFTHLGAEIENNPAGYSPGRFDQYMYPYYHQDIKSGCITMEQAAELLGCLWVNFTRVEKFRPVVYTELAQSMYQNVTIGGQTCEGRDATNELSYLILDVTEAMKLIQPTVSLRYFDGLDKGIVMKAAEVMRNWGAGIPAWFNDKVALTVLPSYGIPIEEARNWNPIGCVEMGLMGKTPLLQGASFLSLAKCLELALNNGFDTRIKREIGPATGDPRNFKSYEELFEAFKQQLIHALDITVYVHNSSYALHAENVPVPFLSSLMDDCIAKGMDITEGGARYNTLICWFPREIIDTANSLIAVKKLVFDEQKITMNQLLSSLAANFEGYEEVRKMLLEAPKYGNDDDYADAFVNDIYKLCKEITVTGNYKNQMGEKLAVAFLGITAHHFFGKTIGALPSGRKAYLPCTDGSLSATSGTDVKGPTALIKSAAKINFMPGLSTILNIKTSPQLVKGHEGLMKFVSLIKTYFDLCGYHVQFNVLDKDTLLKARKSPMEYRELIVRVAGFSMFWIELAPSVQDEIINRTEHVM